MIITIENSVVNDYSDREGLVCVGTGGDLDEWVDGVNEILFENDVTPRENYFTDAIAFKTGEINNLLFLFPEGYDDLDMGKMAIVRLQYINWMKWLSDYIENNKDQLTETGIIEDDDFEIEDYDEKPDIVFIEGRRDGYSPSQCRRTLTVDELVDVLSQYDGDSPVYLSNDNGYTFGSISEMSFSCEGGDGYE